MKSYLILLFGANFLFALPSGPNIIQGSAELISSPEILEIQLSDQSIIDWQSFNISENERVHFLQPSSNSAVLNRVIGGQASQLFGQLQANGQVLLINPSGIVFGKSAQIDLFSLVASTLDLQNDVFLSGKEWTFAGDSTATIFNEGTIHAANDLFLTAFSVVNQGTLKGQEVGLIAAREWGFNLKGSDRLYFRTTGDSVIHTGEIFAQKENCGGDAYLLGDQVILAERALIDASHPFGGGQVLIGGDYQGKNESIANAKYVYGASDVTIDVSATEIGNGGKAILWGDETNHLFGSILACGGEKGGNGGFIEVSSPGWLIPDCFIDTRAPLGSAGELLLDPTDVTIGLADANTFTPACPSPAFTYAFAGSPATIDHIRLGNLLACANVTVDANVGAGGAGNIIVANAVAWASANSLTLKSAGNITCNAGIQNSGAGNLILIAPTGSTITIQDTTAAGVYVGSQNGLTMIGDPALPRCNDPILNRSRPNVNIFATINGASAHLGFNSGGVTSTGPIDVTCANLSVSSNPAAANTHAAIGHGTFPAVLYTTTAAATITVDASGTIMVTTIFGNGNAQIGHGDNSIAGASTLDGAICVASVGNITLDGNLAVIGHANRGGGAGSTKRGNITVFSNGSITLTCRGSDAVSIGHYTGGGLPFAVTGNINVSAHGNLTLNSPSTVASNNTIGHFTQGLLLQNRVTSDITVNVLGNLAISTSQAGGGTGIGIFANGVGGFLNNTGNVNVNVGGNISVTTTQNGVAYIAYIGSTIATLASAPVGNGFSNTNVAAGGTITLTQGSTGGVIRIRAPNLVSVSSFGDLKASGSGALAVTDLFQSYISTENNNILSSTTIKSGGKIQSVTLGARQPFLLGQASLDTVGKPWHAAINIQAGSTIAIPYTISTADAPVTLSTPTSFGAGALLSAQNLTTCMNPACEAAIAIPASNANVPVNTAANNYSGIDILTVSGAITVTAFINNPTCPCPDATACVGPCPCPGPGICPCPSICACPGLCSCPGTCPGAVADINIGAVPANNVHLSTTSGTINITNYNNINIKQALATASNSVAACMIPDAIFVRACNDITVALGNSVSVTGTGSIAMNARNNINVNAPVTSTGGRITIFADNDLSGAGNLNIASNINSGGGNIFLQAGADNKGCSMQIMGGSINQTAGAINSGAGNLSIIANFDLTLSSPSNPSMTTTTGYFHTQAGRDTILTNTTLSKTGAGTTKDHDFLMISGRDMKMTNSHITATTSFVTLVVDNCFPVSPLIGPGAFVLDATSTIDPINLRIFTALRPQNTINGTLNGVPFVPGTLFVDTATELWCQYFAFPFAYPFSNLGVPYTIFYKDCLGPAMNQAQIIVTQFLLDLHPFNEFPGWQEEFYFHFQGMESSKYTSSLTVLDKEPYYITHRHLHPINQPKTYTTVTNDTYLERTREGDLRLDKE